MGHLQSSGGLVTQLLHFSPFYPLKSGNRRPQPPRGLQVSALEPASSAANLKSWDHAVLNLSPSRNVCRVVSKASCERLLWTSAFIRIDHRAQQNSSRVTGANRVLLWPLLNRHREGWERPRQRCGEGARADRVLVLQFIAKVANVRPDADAELLLTQRVSGNLVFFGNSSAPPYLLT